MLEKSFCGPTGTNCRGFVAKLALEDSRGRTIVVIVQLRELQQQWKKLMPDAVIISLTKAMNSVEMLDGCLLIFEPSSIFNLHRSLQKLHGMPNEVWMVNLPLDRALRDANSFKW